LVGAARREDNPRDRAAAFLEQFLADGPRTVDDVWDAAQKAGLSERTVQRAKRGLGIRCRRVTRDGRPFSFWLLRGQVLPDGLSDTPELDRFLAELERQYPPRSPLEEEEDLESDLQ
jgi:hypothetical protein